MMNKFDFGDGAPSIVRHGILDITPKFRIFTVEVTRN